MKEKNIDNKKLLFLSRKFSCRYSNRSFLIPLFFRNHFFPLRYSVYLKTMWGEMIISLQYRT